jgi:hypothetical protein
MRARVRHSASRSVSAPGLVSIGRAPALLLVLTAATLWAAGCSGGEDGTSLSTAVTTTATPTSTATSAIPATTLMTQTVATQGENDIHGLAAASWSPVESIPEADAKSMSDALSARGLCMLFPSAVPFAAAGPVSGEFTMQWVPATGVIDLIVHVGTDDGAWVAVMSSPTPSDMVMFGTEDTTRATEIVVRGQPGRLYPRSDETTQIISWQEGGQYFVAWHRWLPEELAAEQMIGWLESWYWLDRSV